VKALELEGVHAGYGRTRVLRGVDLTVPEGATVALLGANGAGKTTLLRAAAGLLPVSAGVVRLGGRPAPTGADTRARAGLCLVPEGRGIFPRLTVEENVALFAGGRRRRAEAFDRVTAVFGVLGERRRQVAGTMSGGQQQMLAFARALCTDAAVVLADELSFGLAPIVLDELFEAVAGLREAGRSVLVVEQFVDRVLGLADWIYVLDKGTVTFVGEPAQLADGGMFERYLGSGRG
jgi:branched-chain amino acid transport system ATP-binding protein